MATYGVHNWYIYHISGLVELVFAYYIYRILGSGLIWKYLFLLFSCFYLIDSFRVYLRDSAIADSIHGSESFFINNLGLGLSSLFTLALGVAFLLRLYRENRVLQIEIHPPFYINAGFMLYAAASFLFFFFSIYTTLIGVDDMVFYASWTLVSLLLLVKCLLIATAFIIELRCSQN